MCYTRDKIEQRAMRGERQRSRSMVIISPSLLTVDDDKVEIGAVNLTYLMCRA